MFVRTLGNYQVSCICLALDTANFANSYRRRILKFFQIVLKLKYPLKENAAKHLLQVEDGYPIMGVPLFEVFPLYKIRPRCSGSTYIQTMYP